MKKIFIDCDPGIDDSLAILYALKRKDVKVMGITTGFGNCSAKTGAINALKLIKLANIDYDIPVTSGAEVSYIGNKEENYPTHIHGDNGLGNAIIEESDQKLSDLNASELLIKVAKENPNEVTLIALGRMSNIANALDIEKDLPKLYKNLVYMGGTLIQEGNVAPFSEANIAGDPEAADKVFQAGFDILQVGLDITQNNRIHLKDLEDLYSNVKPENKKIADYFKEAFKIYFKFNEEQTGIKDSVPMHDPSAVLLALEEDLILEKITYPSRVETKGEFTRGMTIIDKRLVPFDAKNVSYVTKVDNKKCVSMVLDIFK